MRKQEINLLPELMRIEYLADHLHHIPTVAQWLHAEWGHLEANATLTTRIQKVTRQAKRQEIPAIFVALEGDTVLGSASLVKNDLSSRPELTPWLASVYVDLCQRQRGIGSTLVRRVMDEACALGVETLYLITPDQQNFYARLGWKPVENVHYRGENVTLMTWQS